MKTQAHLDWLAVTFPAGMSCEAVVPREIGAIPFSSGGPSLHGYANSRKNDNGAMILSGGTEAQGVHVILPSDALLAARADGLADQALCVFVRDRGGRASRIDLAVDLYDGQMLVSDLHAAYEAGQVQTSVRTVVEISNLNTPERTLYFGSMKGNRFFRAYNKGAQVKSEIAWLRLEMQIRHLYASATSQAFADAKNPRAFINASIRSFVDFPTLPEFVAALSDTDAILPQIPRKIGATYRWLIEQVAPCLARYQFQHPDEEIDRAFLAAWKTAYDQIVRHRRADARDPG